MDTAAHMMKEKAAVASLARVMGVTRVIVYVDHVDADV